MPSEGSAPIESVDRALRLVELLRDEGAVTVTDAAERLGVAPSTAHRLLAALIHRGFAVQDGGRRTYRAGPALAVRREALTIGALRDAVLPALDRLQRQMAETAQLVVRQGPDIRFVNGVESDAPLRVAARFGDVMPAYVSSGGKALLADLDDGELDRLYPDGLPAWRTARLTSVEELKEQLDEVRKLGYATNLEETEPGVCGVGVAFRDSSGEARGALTLAVPSVRFRHEELARYVAAVQDAAVDAEQMLARVGQPGSRAPRR